MGGVSGVVWAIFGFFIGDFESFKYENALIGSIYPTSPFGDNPEDSANPSASSSNSDKEAKHEMMRTVAERGKYFYSYFESRITSFLNLFCSCCLKNKAWFKRRLQKQQRHQKASDMLSDEIDIVKFIYVLRIGQFISKMFLRKH